MVKNWQTAFSRVRAALMRRGRTLHDAEDLVQEAWVRLACYERQQTVAEPEAFLMRAALNLSTDFYRASRIRGEQVLLDDVVRRRRIARRRGGPVGTGANDPSERMPVPP